MHMYWNATIEVDEAAAPVYEFALGEYATHEDGPEKGLPVKDDEGRRIPINAIEFPLPRVNVTWNGRRATLLLLQPGKAGFVLDRFMDTAEPVKKPVRGQKGKEVVTFSGKSERMLRQGINAEDSIVTVTVKEWSADKISQL